MNSDSICHNVYELIIVFDCTLELGASKLKPSAKRPQCSFVWGVELSREGAINDGKKVNTTSEFECCALCNKTPGNELVQAHSLM